MQIKKRNGELEPFDGDKIYRAVMKAAISENVEGFEDTATMIANDVQDILEDMFVDVIDIEEVQNLVEVGLFTIANRPDLAKSYILFREQRRLERERVNKYKSIIRNRAIHPEDANQRGNANLDENSFSGRMFEASEELWKEVALEDFVPADIAKLHRNGELYLHDLGRFALGQSNCLTFSFRYPFEHGFKLRNSELRPPSRFSTAAQLVAVIIQIASQSQFGGATAGCIDRDLAPFAEKSYYKNREKFCGLDIDREGRSEASYYEELRQGAESLIHNLSSLQSRPGSQLPFSSLNLGLDTSRWGRDVTRAILTAMIDGVGPHHLTPTFPIICFQLRDGVNKKPGDPNYDLKLLAIECCTKRLTPNFVNTNAVEDNPENPDTWLTAMGCRTQMAKDIHNPDEPFNRLGRGNLAPHTINLVPAAIKYGVCEGKRKEPDLDGFINEFGNLLRKAEESLLIRAEIMFRQKQKAAYEYYVNHLWTGDYEYDPEASVYEVLKHGTLAIGIVGIANAMRALFGEDHFENELVRGVVLGLAYAHKKFCAEASERNNLNFSAYATPAENLSYTLMKIMKKRFGVIPGVTDTEYLTNSYHVPVYHNCSPFEKLDIESMFANMYPGGNISYFEIDSKGSDNLEGIEQIIDYGCSLGIPYIAFNVPLDECPDCGFKGEEIPETGCPQCGAPDKRILRIRRVTGYISSDYRTSFNAGKQNEVLDRVKHTGREVKPIANSENNIG